jgi:hypothetical protein
MGGWAARARARLRRGGMHQRVRALEQRLDHERLYPVEWANRRVRDRFGNAVRAGPFRALRYPDWGMTAVDAFSPKVLGAFERELHEALEAAIARRPSVVVNIGAAEGYYAVGLALRLPDAHILAFEPRDAQAEQLTAIAELNGATVDLRVEHCTPEKLDDVLAPGALIVCDCDGCEAELLDPAAVPALAGSELIVEAHDLLVPGTTDRLVNAFTATHEVARIDAEPRFVDDFPETDFMPLVTRQLAISEFRQAPMWWLIMRPRAAG